MLIKHILLWLKILSSSLPFKDTFQEYHRFHSVFGMQTKIKKLESNAKCQWQKTKAGKRKKQLQRIDMKNQM